MANEARYERWAGEGAMPMKNFAAPEPDRDGSTHASCREAPAGERRRLVVPPATARNDERGKLRPRGMSNCLTVPSPPGTFRTAPVDVIPDPLPESPEPIAASRNIGEVATAQVTFKHSSTSASVNAASTVKAAGHRV